MYVFAREFGYSPEQTINLPFHHRWALLDGLNKTYAEESGAEHSSGAVEDDYDPRFPSASRGDVMASPEELMALGMQYSRE